MSGSNGLHPVVNLGQRQKCPKHPSKRKYTDGAEAGRAAQQRSKDTGLPIEAYMCEACGNYHLTRSTGGDSTILTDGKFSIGEFKSLAPHHPVFSENAADEPPIVPGDHETRVRFARRFLEANPTPTSEELCIALGGCTKTILRRVMTELGYRNTRGRYAHWVKVDAVTADPEPADEPDSDPEDTRIPLDLSYDNDAPDDDARWMGGRSVPWREVRPIENLERLRHIALGDLMDTYAAAGFRLTLTLESANA
uniref:Helix-turn-helix DNA binding domain protein n=2 Tax=unclassified bacterial viruses TaxID=12333 RepID=A0AAU7J815_9VIRU